MVDLLKRFNIKLLDNPPVLINREKYIEEVGIGKFKELYDKGEVTVDGSIINFKFLMNGFGDNYDLISVSTMAFDTKTYTLTIKNIYDSGLYKIYNDDEFNDKLCMHSFFRLSKDSDNIFITENKLENAKELHLTGILATCQGFNFILVEDANISNITIEYTSLHINCFTTNLPIITLGTKTRLLRV